MAPTPVQLVDRARGRIDEAEAAAHPLLEPCEPLEGYGLSTYTRCSYRCRYCITGVQGASVPRVELADLPRRLEAELALRHPGRIGVGLFCDAYPPVEAELGLTRRALELLVERPIDLRVITKGLGVRRDVDLLAGRPKTGVNVSLCSTREDLLRPLDGLAPTPRQRLDLLHELAAAGVSVELALSPWIPGVTDTAALIDAVDPAIPIRITPLRVRAPKVIDTAFGREWDQEAVNAAFEQEFAEVGERRNVFWSPVAPLDGSAPHVSVLVSRPGRVDRLGQPRNAGT
jgi:DNA repair photolyase